MIGFVDWWRRLFGRGAERSSMPNEAKLLRVRLRKQGRYKHFYGHDERLKGLELFDNGEPKFPAQLVLTLDMRDPLLKRLDVDVGPKLRLVHPFAHLGGHAGAYKHLSENEIRFEPPISFQYSGGDDQPHDNFPRTFQHIPVGLEIEEPPAGDLTQRYGPDKQGPAINEHSPYIWPYPTGTGVAIFLGSNQQTIQDHRMQCCDTPSRLLARFPSQPNIWQESCWPEDVYGLFWYCPKCKSIITHNEV
jgi:hypothetical protein